MKRKFSINPLPVMKKSMSKPDINSSKHVPQSPLTQLAVLDQHDPKNDVCDFSPFINRRALTVQTERELREACGHVLQNFKPSDHGLEDTDPKLDFGAIARRIRSRKPTVAEIQVKKPTGAPQDMVDLYAKARACTDWELNAKSQPLEPVPSNTSRRRADSNKSRASFTWLDGKDEAKQKKRTRSKQLNPHDLTISHTQPGMHCANSTAGPSDMASAPHIPAVQTLAQTLNPTSRPLDDPAAVADAQATEWMRQELDKRRQSSAAHPGCPLTHTQSVMTQLSRTTSQEPLQRTDTHMSLEKRPGSSNGWRGWTLPRRSSSRSSRRLSISRMNADQDSSRGDLDWQLPALPGLDTWREPVWSPQQEETILLSPTQPSHHYHHTRAGSDISMMQSADFRPQSPVQARPSSSDSGTVVQTRRLPRRINTGVAQGHLNLMMGEWTSPTTVKPDYTKFDANHHARRTSADSVVASPNTDTSSQSPTCLRNPGLDAPLQKQVAPEEQKSRLRRVFSGWVLKKERKDDWMHKMEKQGNGGGSDRPGIFIQEGAGTSPVMRY